MGSGIPKKPCNKAGTSIMNRGLDHDDGLRVKRLSGISVVPVRTHCTFPLFGDSTPLEHIQCAGACTPACDHTCLLHFVLAAFMLVGDSTPDCINCKRRWSSAI
jgi:hypothetical protein